MNPIDLFVSTLESLEEFAPKVAQVWQAVLGSPVSGPEADFFDAHFAGTWGRDQGQRTAFG